MSAGEIVMIIAAAIVAFLGGYSIGYRDCFNYLKQELEEFRRKRDHERADRGTDQHI